MNKKNGPSLGHNKKSLLKSEVEHIDITSFDSRKIIESMKKMSFTSRDTAKAAEIYNEMINDKDCAIFLTIVEPLSATNALPGSQIISGSFSNFKLDKLFLISLKYSSND